ncbi:MAG TPA: MarR family transcriptional regulator [Solirubrobacterales bacterium]|nr:MarR family transcriptional regulator [Solirubrobacterales bacterium]
MEAASRTRKTDPREAAGEFSLKLGAFLMRCMGGASSDVFKVIDESGLTFSQMKVLVELEAADEDARTVTALSEELGISPASASRAAEGMVRKKLATRVEDPDDRRVRRLALTSRGRELADRIISARLAGLEDFTASLSGDERRKLESALDALLERPEVAEIYRNYERKARR